MDALNCFRVYVKKLKSNPDDDAIHQLDIPPDVRECFEQILDSKPTREDLMNLFAVLCNTDSHDYNRIYKMLF